MFLKYKDIKKTLYPNNFIKNKRLVKKPVLYLIFNSF